MMKSVCETVSEEYENERIDKYITSVLTDISRSFIQKLIKDEKISVNGKLVKANYKVKTDDIVSFTIPDAIEPEIEAQDIPLCSIRQYVQAYLGSQLPLPWFFP